MNKLDLYVQVLFRLRYWVFIILIITIGIIRASFGDEEDPMDNSINKVREHFTTITVTDSTHNGFEVTYATTKLVTKARLDEIRSRVHITRCLDSLKSDAPIHFESLLDADIHDFATFALNYDPDPDIYIDHIFVYGYEKERFYIGNNPEITNPATWYDSYSKQGIQYIKRNDFFYCQERDKRIYRYYKCSGINSTSRTDERYSHFSEDKRL